MSLSMHVSQPRLNLLFLKSGVSALFQLALMMEVLGIIDSTRGMALQCIFVLIRTDLRRSSAHPSAKYWGPREEQCSLPNDAGIN